MARKVAARDRVSKTATRIHAGGFPHSCGWFLPILLELQNLFPRDTAAEIAHRAGRSISVAERWIARRCVPDGQALAALLRSDVGDAVHAALIASVKSPWADNLRAVREIAKLRQQQADAARRLEALERGIR